MQVDVAIIGAGFAGVSTAYHLTKRFSGSVLLLEKEAEPGLHASGRNASLVLQSGKDSEVNKLTSLSVEAYQSRIEEVGFRQTGSLLLGNASELQRRLKSSPVDARIIPAEDARKRVPLLEGHEFEAALWTPTDGVMDIKRLLAFYLNQAISKNVEIALTTPVENLRWKDRWQIQTGAETFEAGTVVNAAGAWARPIAELAGHSFEWISYKRHLYFLALPRPLDPDWPFVWDLTHDFYFRPHGDNLLFCICDETAAQKELSLEPDLSIWRQAEETIDRFLPGLQGYELTDQRCCYRTFSEQHAFEVGWMPGSNQFFNVVAVGGHGMGSSWAIGELAAQMLLDRL